MESELIKTHLNILRELQTKSGLFLASSVDVETGYDKAWLRDNFYETLAFEEGGDWAPTKKAFRAILDIFLKHESKIKWATEQKPTETWQYIHARYNPETFEEYWEEWGNKQNDAIGAMLYKFGMLEEAGQGIIQSDDDRRIVQRLVDYLRSVEYWHDADSGMWEEHEEVHASSIGACVAGLERARAIPGITVPDALITRGRDALLKLLPRESKTKFTDLALLSLIWPYNVVDNATAKDILGNLEYHLDRDRGVVRYRNDKYYNKNDDEISEEAEWTMGLAWLSIIYHQIGDVERAREYFEKAHATVSDAGTIPELYYSHSNQPNENNPLGWAESLFIVSAMKLAK